MDPNAQLTSLLRGELTDLISASCFLFIGFIALAIAAIRRRGGVRVLVWIGLWSFLFGSNMLAQSAAVSASLPPSLESLRALWVVSCTYLTIVAAALAFLELTLGKLRFFMFMLLSADLLVAIAGIGS